MTDDTNKTPDEKTEEPSNAGAPPPAAESTPPPVEPENIAPPGTTASLGNRILAVLIDGLIVMALSIVLMPVANIGYLIGLAYILIRDAIPFLDGQSIGKKVMKLRAVSTETGKSLTNDWAASALRNILLVVPLIGAVVELIVLSSNPEKGRLGDQWAKTKVIVVAE